MKKIIKHTLKKKIWFYNWYKWIVLILLILLLLCFFLKGCKNFKDTNSGINSHNNEHVDNNRFSNSKEIQPLPLQRGNRSPIDPRKIESDPNDPLSRNYVNDIINVYLKDSVDIEHFSETTQKKLF